MKYLILIFMLLSSLSLMGQDNISGEPSEDLNRFKIGLNLSPDLCYRTLKSTNASPSNEAVIKNRNELEIAKICVSAGINVNYSINELVSIESGLHYSQKGYRTKLLDINVEPWPISSSKIKIRYNFHYIDIPLKVNFTFGENRLRFITSIGLTTNILIEANETRTLAKLFDNDKITFASNVDYSKLNISPTVSVGIDYKITDNMSLRIEPTFRHGLLKMTSSPLTAYLYSGGLNIGYYIGI